MVFPICRLTSFENTAVLIQHYVLRALPFLSELEDYAIKLAIKVAFQIISQSKSE